MTPLFWLLSLALGTLASSRYPRHDLLPRQTTNTTSTGDSQCTRYMCIKALVNDTTVEYQLSSRGSRQAGWMAMGFGTEMAGSPMVIMWKNSDGTFTLSQREASGEVLPAVVSNPPRVATLQSTLSSASGTDATFVYTIDANGDTEQNIIYAFGTVNPGSSNSNTGFAQHLDAGTLRLNLAGTVDTSSNSSGSTGSGSAASGDPPLRLYERLIVAHGIVCTVGFLLLLPFGSLLARYLRTFSPTWYTGHWISQFGLGGPVIIVGVVLGIASVAKAGAFHLDDDHKKWGIAIFVLYFVQCGLGAVIHWFKRKSGSGRPPQNYLHAVLGLLLIGLSFYQVRTGYHEEWPSATGRDPLPNGVNIVFWIWVAIFPVLYVVGLMLFLRKQYRQEAEARKGQ